MKEERLYDYSKGLNAHWIQEIKTKKGTRLWYFATPMQLSFFIVFIIVLWPCYSLEGLSLCHSQKSLTQFLSCSIGIFRTNWPNFILNTSLTVKDARLYRRLPDLLLGF